MSRRAAQYAMQLLLGRLSCGVNVQSSRHCSSMLQHSSLPLHSLKTMISLRNFTAQSIAEPSLDNSLHISDAAVHRLRELSAHESTAPYLRLAVEGGGCSGFQYEFTLDPDGPKDGDRVFNRDGVSVICDDISLDFLKGATIDFESDLMRSSFVVQDNPNAEKSCGCGTSFAAK